MMTNQPNLTVTERSTVAIRAAEKVLRERKFLAPGAKVIFITDLIHEGERTSSASVRTMA